MTGTVHLVGAGPGAPDLLTLRAARLLGRADIVFFDALVHPDTLALAARAVKVAVGKRCGRHATAQRFIEKRLIDAARQHAVVVRLKGGDPLLFGRAQEEIDALCAAGIAVEIVPGVSAAFAASAALGTSLTERGVARSLVIATPRVGTDQDEIDWAQAVLAADTAALYMAGGQASAIAALLIARGKGADTPVIVVESASLPEERVVATTLDALAREAPAGAGGPVLLLLGSVYERCLAARGRERRSTRGRVDDFLARCARPMAGRASR